MDLILRARTNMPLDAAFVCLRTLLLFSWGGDPWVQAIGGDQIQELVTDPPEAAVAGATIEADQADSGLKGTVINSAVGGYIIHGRPVGPCQLRVSKTGFKT